MVSIIIPVIRPKGAGRCKAAIKKNAGDQIKYEIVTSFDKNKIGAPKMVKKLTRRAKYDLVMFLGDDTIPHPYFLDAAVEKMKTLPDGWGVVGLNTEGPSNVGDDPDNSNPIAHWLIHKKMLKHIPGGAFFATEYKHCFGDNELMDIAKELGRWAFAKESHIEHRHPINKSAKWDSHYARAYKEDVFFADQRTYCKRKRTRMQKRYGTRLAVAIPLTDIWVYTNFFFSFVNIILNYLLSLAVAGKQIGIDVLMPDFPCQVDAARNDLVNQALLLGCTHILMMDTDQIYLTENMIDKMLAHNKPVVGGRVHRRYPPFDPLLLRGKPGKLYQVPDKEIRKPDGTFENDLSVKYTGAGCVLYDTNVFIDMIPDRWFQFKVGDHGQAIGEDIVFCDKLKKHKIPIIVDCSIDIKHLTLLAADWGTYRLFQKLMGKNKVQEAK